MRWHRLLCRIGIHAPFVHFSYRPLGFLGDHEKLCWSCLVCQSLLGSTKRYDKDKQP